MAKKSVIIATDFGVEEAEIISPRDALTSAGINVTIASNSGNDIQTVAGDKDWASTVNADTLRIDRKAQRILNEFASAHKPVGAICHAPWALIDAELTHGKTMTSYQSIRTDLENAGAHWVNTEVIRCPWNDWILITSRNPHDLPAFTKALVDELS